MTLVILTLLFSTARGQEAAVLPCGPWQAIDASVASTTLLGESQRRQLLDASLRGIERSHVDPGFDGVDLGELRQAYEGRVLAARDDREVAVLLDEMLAWVDGGFRSREELEQQQALGAFTGVGIQVSPLSDGHVLGVNFVFPGSPAEAAGLARGDRILAVDPRTACPHPNDIRGPAGSDVTLTVSSPGQSPRRVTITRAAIEPSAPPRASRLDEPAIGYLWPGNVATPGHAALVRAALEGIGAFDGADALDGLILDLRGVFGDGPQAIDAIRDLAGLFLAGPLGALVERSARTTVTATRQPVNLDGVALVILVDVATNRFPAMLASAMQDRRRALVVGQAVDAAWRLYRFERLPHTSEVLVPVGEFELLDGTRLRLRGFTPDSVMAVDWRDYRVDADPYVAEAIRLIRTGGIGSN